MKRSTLHTPLGSAALLCKERSTLNTQLSTYFPAKVRISEKKTKYIFDFLERKYFRPWSKVIKNSKKVKKIKR